MGSSSSSLESSRDVLSLGGTARSELVMSSKNQPVEIGAPGSPAMALGGSQQLLLAIAAARVVTTGVTRICNSNVRERTILLTYSLPQLTLK